LRWRRRSLVTFAVLFTISAAWSLATPLTAAPDEPAQIIKAAAVVRGEFVGTPLPLASYGTNPRVKVDVPAALASTNQAFECFAFHPRVPASCAPAVRGSGSPTVTETYAGRYPPLYYMVVGLPSLAFPSSAGIRLMRLLSALLCCVFFALAFESATQWRRPGLAVAAVAVAVTPMIAFLAAVVNPNSLEIAAALCLWVSGLALVRADSEAPTRKMMARSALSAAVLVEMRGISWLWLGLILLTIGAVASRTRLRQIVADPVSRVWIAVVAISTGFSLWWLFTFDSLAVLPTGAPLPRASFSNLLEGALGQTDLLLRQMIGIVGWLDTPAPSVTFYVWSALLGVAILGGLALGTRRASTVLGVLTFAVVAVPVALNVYIAPTIGFGWQGRYTLPLAVGVPVVAALALSPRRGTRQVQARPLHLGVSLLAVAQAAIFFDALRRYSVGTGGSIDFFGGRWQPPLGAAGLTALFVVALVGYTMWLAVLCRPALRVVEAYETDVEGEMGQAIGGSAWASATYGPRLLHPIRAASTGRNGANELPANQGL
jgi:hypothetical protein